MSRMSFKQAAEILKNADRGWDDLTDINTLSNESKNMVLLSEISRQLGSILALLQCHNVRNGFVAMQEVRDLVRSEVNQKKKARKTREKRTKAKKAVSQ